MFETLFSVAVFIIILRLIAVADNLIRVRKDMIVKFDYTNTLAKKGKIVLFGDSLTDFYPVQDYFPDLTIYNRGIAGDTAKQLYERIENIINLSPSEVFLQIGTNDMSNGTSVKKIAERIEKITTTIVDRVPDVKIRIISCYPISKTRMIFSPLICGLRSNKKLVKLNTLLIELSKKYGYEYIDIHSHLTSKKGTMKTEYTVEGLHLSTEGYKVISNILKDYFDKK